MNRLGTKLIVERNNVVALKADKSVANPEIDQMLEQLGNSGKTLPYFAIFPANGDLPITFDGPITQTQVVKALIKAGPSVKADQPTDTALTTVAN